MGEGKGQDDAQDEGQGQMFQTRLTRMPVLVRSVSLTKRCAPKEHVEYGEDWDGIRRETHMVATVLPKEKIEVYWGRHHGGWIKGQVVEPAGPDDEIVEMEGQPTKVRCYSC